MPKYGQVKYGHGWKYIVIKAATSFVIGLAKHLNLTTSFKKGLSVIPSFLSYSVLLSFNRGLELKTSFGKHLRLSMGFKNGRIC